MNINQWYNAHIILVQGTFVILLLALSIQIPIRMGVFSFAGIGFYGVGEYTSAIVVIRYNWPSYLAIAAGMVLAAAVGLLLGLIVARLSGLYLGMATIAFDLILTVAINNGGTLTGGAGGLYGAIATVKMSLIVVLVVIILVLAALSERGRTGRRIEALREDPQLAVSMGINVRRVQLLSFAVSGMLGALAGGLNALLRSTVSPADLGFSLVVLALTMIIVGGARSWLGAAIGAIIFTWLPSVLSVVGQWQAVIYGAIVALAAVWLPGGLVGLTTDLFRTFTAKRRRQPRLAEPAPAPVAEERELTALEALVADPAGTTS